MNILDILGLCKKSKQMELMYRIELLNHQIVFLSNQIGDIESNFSDSLFPLLSELHLLREKLLIDNTDNENVKRLSYAISVLVKHATKLNLSFSNDVYKNWLINDFLSNVKQGNKYYKILD